MQKKPHPGTSRIFKIVALTAVLGLISACKSYHLGLPAEISFNTLYIAPVENHSYAPQAQAMLSAMLRENFNRDTRVRVVAEKENADAHLLVDLTEYERNSTVRNPRDTAIADSFDIRLGATASLLDQRTATYIFKTLPVQATTNAYTRNPYDDNAIIDYQLSERQAMEQLSRDIARRVTDTVLSPW